MPDARLLAGSTTETQTPNQCRCGRLLKKLLGVQGPERWRNGPRPSEHHLVRIRRLPHSRHHVCATEPARMGSWVRAEGEQWRGGRLRGGGGGKRHLAASDFVGRLPDQLLVVRGGGLDRQLLGLSQLCPLPLQLRLEGA